jgi:hypothetical protein
MVEFNNKIDPLKESSNVVIMGDKVGEKPFVYFYDEDEHVLWALLSLSL